MDFREGDLVSWHLRNTLLISSVPPKVLSFPLGTNSTEIVWHCPQKYCYMVSILVDIIIEKNI